MMLLLPDIYGIFVSSIITDPIISMLIFTIGYFRSFLIDL